MDFFTTVDTRRSVRKFSAEKISRETLEKCLRAALLAPNSSNMQLWEFYAVQSAEKRQQLVEACFRQPAAATAAELVVVVARIDHWRRHQHMMLERLTPLAPGKAVFDYYRKVVPMIYMTGPFSILAPLKFLVFSVVGLFRPVPRGPSTRQRVFEVAVKSASLACENFMLAATAEGYGTCPMEGYDEVRVKKLLGLGRGARVVMVIAMGKTLPEGIYGPRIRFDENLFIKFC